MTINKNNKWESNIKPFLGEIEKWSRTGKNGQDISKLLGISYTTFRKYAREQKELQGILDKSKRHVQNVVERALAEDRKKKVPRPKPTVGTYAVQPGIKRPDRNGQHRRQFEINKKKIYATQDVCGICGQPVDKSLPWRNPMSKCVDHIIPVARGGHPSDMDNLQLAHRTCNASKSDAMPDERMRKKDNKVINNRVLPQPMNWKNF